MAKKEQNNNQSGITLNLFNSVGGILVSFLTVASIFGSAGFFLGHIAKNREYESQIDDLRHEKIQMQIEFQRQLLDERTQWERRAHLYSIDELKEILASPIELVQCKNFNK